LPRRSSGSGKTTVTLGLLRALKRRGVALAPGKAGPDYIDPAFHAAASGQACLNYDPWAMRRICFWPMRRCNRKAGGCW
jgi:cobyrinic acid a,c-diamide synthase